MSGTATIDTESKDEQFVQAKWYLKRDRRTVNLHVVHDMEAPEGPRTAENCARDFATRSADHKGSAHKCIDTDSVVRSVHDKDQAAAAPGSNSNGLHYELCGYARQTPEEWMDPDSVHTMYNAAREIADDMHRYNNRPLFRTAADLRSGHLDGWTTHWQVSLAFNRSTHTDPGPGFPIDHFGRLILDHYNGTPSEGDPFNMLTDAEQKEMLDGVRAFRQWAMIYQAQFNDADIDLDEIHDEMLSPDRINKFRDTLNVPDMIREDRASIEKLLKAVGELTDTVKKLEAQPASASKSSASKS